MAFLLNLPNQGGLQHIKIDHYEPSAPVYVCSHDSSAPADQVIEFDDSDLLIRTLGRLKRNEATSLLRKRGVKAWKRKRESTPPRKGAVTPARSSKRSRSALPGLEFKFMVVDYTTVDHIPLHRLQKDSFTKPSLKLYLKKHGLKVSGGKQLLFERVLRHRSKMDFETL